MSKGPTDRKQSGGFAAPIRLDSERSAEKLANAKRVEIFELDGITYSMPAAPRAEVALEYLDLMNGQGEDAAAYYLITECLGVDAFRALKAVKGLTDEDFDGIMTRVRAVALPKATAPSTPSGQHN
jgi:hypothetical protein